MFQIRRLRDSLQEIPAPDTAVRIFARQADPLPPISAGEPPIMQDLSFDDRLLAFVIESNRIEGIHRSAHDGMRFEAHAEFLTGRMSMPALERFVHGRYSRAHSSGTRKGWMFQSAVMFAPAGGPGIEKRLRVLLKEDSFSPWERHKEYETLHPFMDGNGRSGRVLWLMDMGGVENLIRGFLHEFYYQTLERQDEEIV